MSKKVELNPVSPWIPLLRLHLMGDPSQSRGERMHIFHVPNGMTLTLKAGRRVHNTVNGTIDIGDPTFLAVSTSDREWRVRWDNLTQCAFVYRAPPSEYLLMRAAASTKSKKVT